MKGSRLILPRGSVVKKYELRIIVIIAISWTLIDLALFYLRMASNVLPVKYSDPETNSFEAIALREINVLILSLIIGFILVTILRRFLHNSSLWINLVVKTMILVLVAMIMNLFIYGTYLVLIRDMSISGAIEMILQDCGCKGLKSKIDFSAECEVE